MLCLHSGIYLYTRDVNMVLRPARPEVGHYDKNLLDLENLKFAHGGLLKFWTKFHLWRGVPNSSPTNRNTS